MSCGKALALALARHYVHLYGPLISGVGPQIGVQWVVQERERTGHLCFGNDGNKIGIQSLRNHHRASPVSSARMLSRVSLSSIFRPNLQFAFEGLCFCFDRNFFRHTFESVRRPSVSQKGNGTQNSLFAQTACLLCES